MGFETLEIPTWIKIFFPMLLAFGVYLMTISSAGVKANKGTTTITKTKAMGNSMNNRLNQVLQQASKGIKQKRNFYTSLGQDVPFKVQMQEMVVNTATGEEGAINIIILIASGILSLAVGFVGFSRIGFIAVFTAISILITAVLFTNMLSIKGNARRQQKALNVLTVLHSQYQNNPTFTAAVAQARDIFSTTSSEYKVINNYYDRVQNLNMNREMALQMMVEELDSNVHIKQYMEIVEQAESSDPTYKLALEGIPLNLKNVIGDRSVYVNNTVITAGYLTICTIAVIFFTFIKPMTSPGAWEELVNVGGDVYMGAGAIIYMALVMVLAYANRLKPEENWGAGK